LGLPAGGLSFLKDGMTTMTQRNAAPLETITPGHLKVRDTPAGLDMQERTVTAITEAAGALVAVACPVFARIGAADQVHLFHDGAVRASIFVTATGRLGIWRSDTDQVTVNTPLEAVRRALDPLRKHTRKLSKAA
jgi:hypothetical protein